LSGESLNGALRVARRSCAACTIGCEHIYASGGGEVRLEYETLFALGPLCGISDREAVLRAAKRCDELGLDTISSGATIAFAMECAERGLLHEEGLRFGNSDMVLSLLDQIAMREGLGALLAEGSRRAADVIGGEAPDFAPHVKGLELPGYEPRALQTMALGFAVGSRGADHNRSGAYEVDFSNRVNRLHGEPEAAALAVETEDRAALMDSLILCKFLRGVFSDLWEESAALLRPVTGWEVTGDELRLLAKPRGGGEETVQPARRLDRRGGHIAKAVPVGRTVGQRQRNALAARTSRCDDSGVLSGTWLGCERTHSSKRTGHTRPRRMGRMTHEYPCNTVAY